MGIHFCLWSVDTIRFWFVLSFDQDLFFVGLTFWNQIWFPVLLREQTSQDSFSKFIILEFALLLFSWINNKSCFMYSELCFFCVPFFIFFFYVPFLRFYLKLSFSLPLLLLSSWIWIILLTISPQWWGLFWKNVCLSS